MSSPSERGCSAAWLVGEAGSVSGRALGSASSSMDIVLIYSKPSSSNKLSRKREFVDSEGRSIVTPFGRFGAGREGSRVSKLSSRKPLVRAICVLLILAMH